MKILITGAAGFIGSHLAKRLAERSDNVIGIDNINDYYDINLKYGRLHEAGIHQNDIEYGKIVQSEKYQHYRFIKLDLIDMPEMMRLFEQEQFDVVCNLAAQA